MRMNHRHWGFSQMRSDATATRALADLIRQQPGAGHRVRLNLDRWMRARAAIRFDNVPHALNQAFHFANLTDCDAIVFEARKICVRQRLAFNQYRHNPLPFGFGVFGEPSGPLRDILALDFRSGCAGSLRPLSGPISFGSEFERLSATDFLDLLDNERIAFKRGFD